MRLQLLLVLLARLTTAELADTAALQSTPHLQYLPPPPGFLPGPARAPARHQTPRTPRRIDQQNYRPAPPQQDWLQADIDSNIQNFQADTNFHSFQFEIQKLTASATDKSFSSSDGGFGRENYREADNKRRISTAARPGRAWGASTASSAGNFVGGSAVSPDHVPQSGLQYLQYIAADRNPGEIGLQSAGPRQTTDLQRSAVRTAVPAAASPTERPAADPAQLQFGEILKTGAAERQPDQMTASKNEVFPKLNDYKSAATAPGKPVTRKKYRIKPKQEVKLKTRRENDIMNVAKAEIHTPDTRRGSGSGPAQQVLPRVRNTFTRLGVRDQTSPAPDRPDVRFTHPAQPGPAYQDWGKYHNTVKGFKSSIQEKKVSSQRGKNQKENAGFMPGSLGSVKRAGSGRPRDYYEMRKHYKADHSVATEEPQTQPGAFHDYRADPSSQSSSHPAAAPARVAGRDLRAAGSRSSRRVEGVVPHPAAGQLEAAVAAGAARFSPEQHQQPRRLSFQIHGQAGPSSYRFGHDTGTG